MGHQAPDKGGQQNQLSCFIVSSGFFLSHVLFYTEILTSVNWEPLYFVNEQHWHKSLANVPKRDNNAIIFSIFLGCYRVHQSSALQSTENNH